MPDIPPSERNDTLDLIQRMTNRTVLDSGSINGKESYDLFDLIPCLITILDRDFRLLKYNWQFCEQFDPKPGDYCYKAYKGRNEKCVECPVEKTFQDGLCHWSEERGVNKDGTLTHWVARTSPIRNSSGEIVAVMEMCLDITRRKQLEEDLEATEKKYQAIFNNIPNSVFILDMDTLEIQDCNQSVESMYGHKRSDIIGRCFLNFFKPEDRDHCESRLRKIAGIDKIRHITKDGRNIIVNISVSVSEWRDRKVLIVATSDITQRLDAEQQLIQAGKMTTLGEMATGIAHELNQPLSVIRTASNYIMRKAKKKEQMDGDMFLNIASKISNNVDRASSIIDHLRDFGRKSDLVARRVEVNGILERAVDLLDHQLKLRGITVTWHLGADLAMVFADPIRLEQVFMNLLLNARDAIEEKLIQKPEGEARINICTRRLEEAVVIAIRDTGVGIPENLAEVIFSPFFTTKEPGKGTGLGLSITYGIIKEYGGSIEVKSILGKGATFIIKLPVALGNE